MAEPTIVETGFLSDKGMKRQVNEDSLALPPPDLPAEDLARKGALYLVADGIGGHKAGKAASDLAARLIVQEYYRQPSPDVGQSLRQAIQVANAEVHRLAQEPAYKKMGTTVVAAIIQGQSLTVAHVGDSRAYLVGQAGIQALTRDHSWVAEQVQEGLLSEKQARQHGQRHVLVRALGAAPEVNVDLIRASLRPGDQVVLCSDGLWELVEDGEIEAAVRQHRPREAVRRLVELANERGGPDNISVVVLDPNPSPPSRQGASGLPVAARQLWSRASGQPWLLVAAAAVVLILVLACVAALLLGGSSPEAAPTDLAVVPATQAPQATSTLAARDGSTTEITATLPLTSTPPSEIRGVVNTDLVLVVRARPSQFSGALDQLQPDAQIQVLCRTKGELVMGDDTWYQTPVQGGPKGYVAAHWIRLVDVQRADVPVCGQ